MDGDETIEFKSERLNIWQQFLDQLFSNRQITTEYCWRTVSTEPKIDWPYFEHELNHLELSVFRSVARIAFYLPQEPFYDVIKAFKWDLDGRNIEDENELIEYSTNVSAWFATICTIEVCHTSLQWPDRMGPKCRQLLNGVRKIGVVNIYYLNIKIGKIDRFCIFSGGRNLEYEPRYYIRQ